MNGYNAAGNLLMMGGSKWTRRLAEVTINQDVDIKQATIFVEWGSNYTSANPAIIRVYQEGLEEYAGIMSVGTFYGETSQSMSVEIRANNGARKIIVDAWDPASSSPNNKASFFGNINLYGQPVFTQTTDQGNQTA